jgi:hypothetical protein
MGLLAAARTRLRPGRGRTRLPDPAGYLEVQSWRTWPASRVSGGRLAVLILQLLPEPEQRLHI